MFKTLMVALAGVGLGVGLTAAVNAQELVEGQHYTLLANPVATQVDEGQIEVTEAFWYGCPHCYRFHVLSTDWYASLDDDVSVVHLPATMGGDWNTHANAYYAAKSLGIEDAVHAGFFEAIHEDGHALTGSDDIAAFFAQYDVSEEDAKQALSAFSVRSDVNKAHSRMREMRLTGVPALVVDGRYVISPQSAGSLENMPHIADALIERVRSERAE